MHRHSVTKDLEAWETFRCLAKSGSVTQASVELDLHPSIVSRYIQALEKELGVTLFDRKKRPFALTQVGEELFNQIEPLLAGFSSLLSNSLRQKRSHIFKISAPTDLSRDYIPDQLMLYSKAHPEIQFDLQTQRSLKRIVDGSIDALLCQYHPSDTTLLNVRPCISATAVLLATPQYLKSKGEPASIAELVNHTGLLQRGDGQIVTSTLYKEGKPSELLKWNNVFIANDQYSLKHLLLENKGITVDLCPQFVVEELNSGAVVPILKGWERAPWELCVVTRKDKESSTPELRQFATWWAQIEAAQSMKRVLAGEEALQKAQSNKQET